MLPDDTLTRERDNVSWSVDSIRTAQVYCMHAQADLLRYHYGWYDWWPQRAPYPSNWNAKLFFSLVVLALYWESSRGIHLSHRKRRDPLLVDCSFEVCEEVSPRVTALEQSNTCNPANLCSCWWKCAIIVTHPCTHQDFSSPAYQLNSLQLSPHPCDGH